MFDEECFPNSRGIYGPMVWWLACLIFTAGIGVRIPVVVVKFHNVYDYTIVRHPWHVRKP